MPALAKARPPSVETKGPESSLPQAVFFSAQEPKAAAARSPDQTRQESVPAMKEVRKVEVVEEEAVAAIAGRASIGVLRFRRTGSKATDDFDNMGTLFNFLALRGSRYAADAVAMRQRGAKEEVDEASSMMMVVVDL
jgi:hypothetical protein